MISRRSDVYPFAAFLADRFGCAQIIDVGCGTASRLAALHPRFRIIGIDRGDTLNLCRQHYGFGTWIDWDLAQPGWIPLPEEDLQDSLIVCADVIPQLAEPAHLLENLRRWMRSAPVCVITVADRDQAPGTNPRGSPPSPYHNREWSTSDLEAVLRHYGFNTAFVGTTAIKGQERVRDIPIAILEGDSAHPKRVGRGALFAAPTDFRVVALMTAYNEEDIIVPSIARLLAQGIEVYLLDNWSNDATHAKASQFIGKGLLGIERFPPDGPSRSFDLRGLLTRNEELARAIKADWFIHHDTDEVRSSPWAGVDLRQGLFAVDQLGYDCVDHTVIVFHPIDNGFPPEEDFEAYFQYYEFGKRPGHFLRLNAWKNPGVPISLARHGGHEVSFPARRVFPYKFLLKHYPVRSQSHGERKVFVERKARWSPDERAIGWHVQYDDIREGHTFLKDPSTLERYEDGQFHSKYLIERLSGIGVL